MKTSIVQIAALLAASLFSIDAGAHGGGLNAEGCHNNRKTGDYHCHRAPARSPVADSYAPAQETMRSNAAGQTRVSGAFANCAQARAAGAAPVKIGEPGYGAHLDRDGDGIGCESSRGRR